MLSIEAKTKMSVEKAIASAVEFFGTGYGLKVERQTDCAVDMVGGGGSVSIAARADAGETLVEITTREWENQAKEFSAKISA